MTALLAKMNRNSIQPLSPLPAEEPSPTPVPAPVPIPAIQPEEMPPAVKQRGRPKKEIKVAQTADFETYRTRFLTRDKEEEMGGLRVQLSRRNSLDLKFIAACTGTTLTTIINNVLRHHIATHADLLNTLTRPALSWAERDKDTDHEQ